MLAVHWSAANASSRRVFTANLSVDYRRPLPAGTRVAVHAKIAKIERRKLFIEAQVVEWSPSAQAAGAIAEARVLYLVEAAQPSV